MREENLRSSFGDASAFFGMDSMRSGGITSAPFNVAELIEEDPPEAGPEDATTLADDEQLMLFKFLALVLENAIKKYPNSVQLKIHSSFIQSVKLNNEFKAIFELMQCSAFDPSIQSRFFIFRRRLFIEKSVL